MRARGGARRAARSVRRFLAVGAALSVAACSTLPPGALDRTMQGRTVAGRMSVRYTDLATGRPDGSSGRFVWTTEGDALELSLLDPFGQTVALIRSEPRHASIVFRDGRRFDGATPEALTADTLGWTAPLHGLRYWLEGRTDPSAPFTTLPDGTVRQDGWTIRFQRDGTGAAAARVDPIDADAVNGQPAPNRIDLAYPGPPVSIEMRLIIDQRGSS